MGERPRGRLPPGIVATVKRTAWGAAAVAAAVLALLALLAGLSEVASAQPDSAPVAGTAITAAEDAQACGPLPSFPAGTAGQIMAGRLTISGFATVTFDPNRDGRINWAQDPFGNPTWLVDFQNAQWIEALIKAYLAGGPNADAYRDRAKTLLLGWLSQVPADNRTPDTLICSAEAFPGQSWIDNQIPGLLHYYASHWDGAFNHGLKQSLQLLGAGCAYPPGAFGGAAQSWRDTAREQMIDSFEPNALGPAIDAQGVTNEQSTGYANFDFGLWSTAESDLGACGLSLPGWITSRIALMPEFLAQATQPDGKLVQIGDTYVVSARYRTGTPLQYAVSRGTSGTPPAQRIAVYSAGYVFGRSSWGTAATFGDQSFYSLRFGPGTEIHGHADHMGLTYYARGRNLIVDAGHTGYEQDAYRSYLLSPEAASDLVMPGVPFDPSASTSLIHQAIGTQGQYYEFYDTAFGGRPRYRSVYVDQDPDLVLVFDRASGASSYEQLWHLDPGLSVTTVTRSYAIATVPGSAGTQLEIRQIPLPGQVIPAGSTQVVEGQVNPYQGWVSHGMLQRTRAPVVTMSRSGSSAAILTLIAPTAPGVAISASAGSAPGGWYRLRLDIGGRQLSFLISPGGDIRAG
jgi:Heparinase II/III-like protein